MLSAANSPRSGSRQQFLVSAVVLAGALFTQAHAQNMLQVCDDPGAAARAPFANTQCNAFAPAAPADGEVVLTAASLTYDWSATHWALEDALSSTALIWATDAGWVLKSQVAFAAPGTGTVIRVHAAGPAYTDSAGNVWSADTGFNSSSYTVNWGAIPISGTSDPTLYQTERYGPNLQYTFTVPNGTYQVNLHFAENWVDATFPNGGIGFSVFSVQANGVTIVSNLDVFATVGAHAALIGTGTVTVTNGQLVLSSPTANGWDVSAIEVIGEGGGGTSVPDVRGKTQAAAATALTGAGLVIGTVTTATSIIVPLGDVISENPYPSSTVVDGSAVALVVSNGAPTGGIPNVIGSSQTAAVAALSGLQLVVGPVWSVESSTVPAGIVMGQGVSAGSAILPGSAVSLTVSSGTTPSPKWLGGIMPTGDSITLGCCGGYNYDNAIYAPYNYEGYRGPLATLLAAAGYSFYFVGTQLSTGGDFFPHEGHAGFTISEIAAGLDGWIASDQPALILLMIGTNDVRNELYFGGVPTNLDALIRQAASDAPTARIIVAQIPPLTYTPYNTTVMSFNAAIPGIVAQEQASGLHVSVADIFDTMGNNQPLDMPDGIHPTNDDYRAMAQNGWLPAIEALH